MNNKILSYVLLSCVGFAFSAYAGPKADSPATVSRVSTSAQNKSSETGEKVDTAGQKMQAKTTGEKIQTKIETLKALKQDITDTVDAGKEIYADASESIGDIKENYEKEIEDFNNSQLGTAASLNKQYSALGKQMEDRKNVLSEELGAKSAAAEQNLKTLQEMYEGVESDDAKQVLEAEIAEAQTQLKEFTDSKQELEQEDSSYLDNDTEYQSLKDQRNQVKSQLSEIALESAALGKSYIEGLLKKNDAAKQAEYSEVIEKNFLLPNEPETAENVARVVRHRQKNFRKDIARVFSKGIALKLKKDKDLEKSEQTQKNISGVDRKLTAGNLLIEQRIEDVKALYDYVDLTMAEMRLKTSVNMVQQDFRLKNYDKNPAVLNLDNYIFSEDDIKSDTDKKSFLDKVKAK